MLNRSVLLRIAIGLVVVAIYGMLIQRNMSEETRRSLELKDNVATADRVGATITVLSVDPVARRFNARIRLQPLGNIATDARTPRVPLKFFMNSAEGQQEFDFAQGRGMTRIEATFPLEGDINRYPFDRYESEILLLMTSPQAGKPKTAPALQDDTPDGPELGVLGLAASAQRSGSPVDLSISLSASTPEMKYTGELVRREDLHAARILLHLRRPDNLISTSVTVMIMMMGIACSVLVMAVTAMTTSQKYNFLPLSLCITLMFSLPAMRNMQPGVPPVGVLGDYLSFIWAELSVAGAAILMAWKWALPSEPESRQEPKS